ncbi:MAG: N-acetyltransferase [Micavibrio sp.]|nr:MAG: N-acetyltransferase [Micavibrio sp.]
MNKLTIRPLVQNDFPQWLPLWDGNNMDQRNEDVTTETWSRLLDPAYPVHGLCAMQEDKMLGFVHYVIHPTTGSIEPVCYMQDVYVDPVQRRKGIARALVEEVAKVKERENWARIYWLAEGDNEVAQELYKDIGVKLNFTLHVLI